MRVSNNCCNSKSAGQSQDIETLPATDIGQQSHASATGTSAKALTRFTSARPNSNRGRRGNQLQLPSTSAWSLPVGCDAHYGSYLISILRSISFASALFGAVTLSTPLSNLASTLA